MYDDGNNDDDRRHVNASYFRSLTDEEREELNTMRNALLVYRLLHFQDKISNIKLNIRNREKQLFKPILRIFQNTDTTLNELLPVVSKYVNQKRESKANTLHAFLYRLVTDLIKARNKLELESSLIWNTVRETLQGKDVPYKGREGLVILFVGISVTLPIFE